MKAKELRSLFRVSIEKDLADLLFKYGFKWRHGSIKFQRSKGDFVQSILFFLTPSKYPDDKSIGHISIMIRLDSKEITKVATTLKGANNTFEAIDTVVNINAGFVSDTQAIDWRPTSIVDMNLLIEQKIKPFIIEKIIPFLDERSSMKHVLNDFENHNTYFFLNSNEVVALLAIAMYCLQSDLEHARTVANDYFKSDDIYREKYKNVFMKLNA